MVTLTIWRMLARSVWQFFRHLPESRLVHDAPQFACQRSPGSGVERLQVLLHQRIEVAHAFDVILQLGQAGEHERNLVAPRADIADGVVQAANLRQQRAQTVGRKPDSPGNRQRHPGGYRSVASSVSSVHSRVVNRAQIIDMRRHQIGDDLKAQVVSR